jgi:hypothetical protein
MKNYFGFALAFFLCFLFSLSSANAAECSNHPESGCVFSQEGKTYAFEEGTYYLNDAMTFTASNIILDCNNAVINYAQNNPSYGIKMSGKSGITIKNCILNNLNRNSNASYAIYSSNSQDINIINNKIKILGNRSTPIRLEAAENFLVENNQIEMNANDVIGIVVIMDSKNGVIKNNNILGIAVFDDDSVMTTANPYGIWLRDAGTKNNEIYDNIINVSGSYGHGISVEDSAGNNNIYDNIIYTYGKSGHGIRFWKNTRENIARNNRIITYGDGGNGFKLDEASSGNNFSSNSVITYGSASSFGKAHGIRIRKTSSESYIEKNNILTFGDAYGVYMQDGVSNIFLDSNIINSSKRNVYIDGSASFVFRNIVIKNNILYNFGTEDFFYARYVEGIDFTKNNIISDKGILSFKDANNFRFENNLIGKDGIKFDVSNNGALGSGYWLLNWSSNNEDVFIRNMNDRAYKINFHSLSNALIYSSDGFLWQGSGDKIIDVKKDNYIYVLDNFNITEGLMREYSPVEISSQSNSIKIIKSSLTMPANFFVLVSVASCDIKEIKYYPGNSSSYKTYRNDSYKCSGNKITLSNLEISPFLKENRLEIHYAREELGDVEKENDLNKTNRIENNSQISDNAKKSQEKSLKIIKIVAIIAVCIAVAAAIIVGIVVLMVLMQRKKEEGKRTEDCVTLKGDNLNK